MNPTSHLSLYPLQPPYLHAEAPGGSISNGVSKDEPTTYGGTILGMLSIDSDPFRNGVVRQDNRE